MSGTRRIVRMARCEDRCRNTDDGGERCVGDECKLSERALPFTAERLREIEARVAELPNDPAVLVRLIEQRHTLEFLAWDNCPEWVALKRAISAQHPEAHAMVGNIIDHWEGTPKDIKSDPGMEKLNRAISKARTALESTVSSSAPKSATFQAWANQLAELSKKAAEGPWFFGHGEGEGGLSVVDDGRQGDDALHAFQLEAHDAELVCWLRNHVAEIEYALRAVQSAPSAIEPAAHTAGRQREADAQFVYRLAAKATSNEAQAALELAGDLLSKNTLVSSLDRTGDKP